MPLFALANAGVHLGGDQNLTVLNPIGLGIILGLVLGKPIGITLFSFIAVKTGMAAKPPGVSWPQFFGIGLLGGIGFTMSIFVATLAFGNSHSLVLAKLGVLVASALAGILGAGLLIFSSREHLVDLQRTSLAATTGLSTPESKK